MNYKLEMVRGSRHILIGYFPTLFRALLISILLDWDKAWSPRVTRNTTE